MSDEIINTVYYDGNEFTINKEIMDYHNLKNGQILTESQFWQVLQDNCRMGIFECRMKLELEQKSRSKT